MSNNTEKDFSRLVEKGSQKEQIVLKEANIRSAKALQTAQRGKKALDYSKWLDLREKSTKIKHTPILGKILSSDFSQPDFKPNFGSDFSNFQKASDDIYTDNPTGGENDGRFSMTDLLYMGDYRIGVGRNITWGAERNATRNWFQVATPDNLKVDTSSQWKEMYKAMVKTDFKRQSLQWGAYERQYGIGYLVSYWGGKDDNMAEEAPNTIPKRFEAISPFYMTPINTYVSRGLSWDPEVWEFTSGHLGPVNGKPFKIHKSRIKVMITRPNANQWRGLSVLDPISLSLSAYLNVMINLLRGFAKFGNTTPVMHTGSPTPTEEEILERMDLLEEMDMNGMYVLGRDDKLEYTSTNFANGLYQAMEIYKEDIASGVQIPLDHLFMRNAAGGLSSGDLTGERTYMNTLANIQMDRTDDYLDIWMKYFPDLEDKTLLWNIAIQRTEQQQLQLEGLKTQNAIIEEQLKDLKMNNKMKRMQIQILNANKGKLMDPSENEQVDTAEEIDDFVLDPSYDHKVMADFIALSKASEEAFKAFNRKDHKN